MLLWIMVDLVQVTNSISIKDHLPKFFSSEVSCFESFAYNYKKCLSDAKFSFDLSSNADALIFSDSIFRCCIAFDLLSCK